MPDDGYYLKAAYEIALKSPDTSTQNGAIIINIDNRSGQKSIATGFNKFPHGVKVTPERLERPLKYSYICHAETNAIYSASFQGIRTSGATMYCPWAACTSCTIAIIEAGITRLVVDERMNTHPMPRWVDEVNIGRQMCIEAGVKVDFLSGPFDVTLLLDGKLTEV